MLKTYNRKKNEATQHHKNLIQDPYRTDLNCITLRQKEIGKMFFVVQFTDDINIHVCINKTK